MLLEGQMYEEVHALFHLKQLQTGLFFPLVIALQCGSVPRICLALLSPAPALLFHF